MQCRPNIKGTISGCGRYLLALPLILFGTSKVLEPEAARGTLAGSFGDSMTLASGSAELALAAWLISGVTPLVVCMSCSPAFCQRS
jgi:hypothetical protein